MDGWTYKADRPPSDILLNTQHSDILKIDETLMFIITTTIIDKMCIIVPITYCSIAVALGYSVRVY